MEQLAEDLAQLSSGLSLATSAGWVHEWNQATAQLQSALAVAVSAFKAAVDAAGASAALAAGATSEAAEAKVTSAREAVFDARRASEAAASVAARSSERVPDDESRSGSLPALDESHRAALLDALREVAGSDEFNNVLDDAEFV